MFERTVEMTIEEVSERYNIPISILQEYESWGLCGEVKKETGSWKYDQTDIERLSLVMTLHDVGFTNEEIERYMRLTLSGSKTAEERMVMLKEKRNGTLDEIHSKQEQLDRLDYLRFDISRTIAETEPSADTAKSLVVYFSWSGNTEKVAKSIQSQTGSDIFEIVPKTAYSEDYNTVVADAKTEQQNNARPEISGTIDNIDDYDTIYVGFPNWWGDMPMILYTFFDTYDLSGKTVALFCTSGGSGLSNTVNEVKELEPNATVTKGLHIGSSASSNPDSAVKSWLDEIGTM